MNVLTRTTRRASLRALVGITAVALTAGATFAPAAQAALVPSDAAHTGLYGSSYAGYDGVYRQSLAILGLHAAEESVDARAVDWLLDQQCANGGFSSFNADPAQACAAFDGNSYTGGTDTNATALAAQALIAVGQTEAAGDAADYLYSVQNADGGWEYTPEAPSASSDPNSTGLVLTALDAANVTPNIANPTAVEYFSALQVGRAGLTAQFPGDEGGITSPYSDGYGDSYATPQVIPGLLGDNLYDLPSPSLAGWDATATVVGTPPNTAAGISDWAASWLETNAKDGNIPDGMTAWVVLSLASTGTGRVVAQDLYEDIKAGAPPTNPGALGQAALAATVLGENADAQRYATLIAATLTTAAGRDSAAPTKHAMSLSSVWVDQTVTVSNPYVGTDLPVTQTVLWGDGTSTALTGATASHDYSAASTYRPTVRVEYAGFIRPGYIALGDVAVAKPAATLKLARSTAWAGASVTLSKSAVAGSPTTTTVNWGDGTAVTNFAGSSVTHVYTKAGTFTPYVTLSNGTGGTTTLATVPANVTVTKDIGKPTVNLTTPSSKTKVSSWRTIKGTATDKGIGVKAVGLKLVEKRGGSWYSYSGAGWTKRSSYTKALSFAKSLKATPNTKGAWTLKVTKLTKGTLKVKYSATDRAGNASATKTATGNLKK